MSALRDISISTANSEPLTHRIFWLKTDQFSRLINAHKTFSTLKWMFPVLNVGEEGARQGFALNAHGIVTVIDIKRVTSLIIAQ